MHELKGLRRAHLHERKSQKKKRKIKNSPECLRGKGDGERREMYGETLGEGPGPAGPPEVWGRAPPCCPEAPPAAVPAAVCEAP